MCTYFVLDRLVEMPDAGSILSGHCIEISSTAIFLCNVHNSITVKDLVACQLLDHISKSLQAKLEVLLLQFLKSWLLHSSVSCGGCLQH